jgi:hypothetical protein
MILHRPLKRRHGRFPRQDQGRLVHRHGSGLDGAACDRKADESARYTSPFCRQSE